MQIRLLDRAKVGIRPTMDEGKLNDQRHGAVQLLRVAGIFATAVPFLMWVYRAHRNLHAWGSYSLDYSPAGAVGWWFVPIANLVKPYWAMKELWQNSDPENFESDIGWDDEGTGSRLVGWWWGFHVAMSVVINMASMIERGAVANSSLKPPIDAFLFATWTYAVGNVLSFVAAVLAIRVVLRIDANQGQRYLLMAEDEQW